MLWVKQCILVDAFSAPVSSAFWAVSDFPVCFGENPDRSPLSDPVSLYKLDFLALFLVSGHNPIL